MFNEVQSFVQNENVVERFFVCSLFISRMRLKHIAIKQYLPANLFECFMSGIRRWFRQLCQCFLIMLRAFLIFILHVQHTWRMSKKIYGIKWAIILNTIQKIYTHQIWIWIIKFALRFHIDRMRNTKLSIEAKKPQCANTNFGKKRRKTFLLKLTNLEFSFDQCQYFVSHAF